MKNYNARTVYYYFRVYQHFLQENNIEDDSKTITVKDLMDYVENHISEEDKIRILNFSTEAY